MKKAQFKLTLSLLAFFLTNGIFSQTSGTLTCSFTEIAKSPTYNGGNNNQHALAVWIQTNAGGFVKTKLRNCCGGSTFDHLPTWSVNGGGTSGNCSAANVVDATTGATKSSFGAVSITWDGKIGPALTGTLQPDGIYKVSIQSTWNHGTSGTATNSYTFTKGPNLESQTITTDPNWSNINIVWTPGTAAGIFSNSSENSEVKVYPNPTNGVFNVDYVNVKTITVTNTLGMVIYNEKIEGISSGTKSIDLSTFTNGIYFITVSNEKGSYNQKLILNK